MYKYFKSNKRNTGDCSIRAFMVVTGWDWHKVFDALCEEGRKKMDMPNSIDAMNALLLKLGFTKEKIVLEKGSRRPTVDELAKKFPNHYIFVQVSNHVVGCKGGDYYDLWDSGYKSAYTYYLKPMEQ